MHSDVRSLCAAMHPCCGRVAFLPQQSPSPCRVEGVKRVTKVAVGEKHSLALQSWCVAPVGLQLPSVAAAAGLGQPARPAVHSDDEDAAAVQQVPTTPMPASQGLHLACQPLLTLMAACPLMQYKRNRC